jgi:hypothetical protein
MFRTRIYFSRVICCWCCSCLLILTQRVCHCDLTLMVLSYNPTRHNCWRVGQPFNASETSRHSVKKQCERRCSLATVLSYLPRLAYPYIRNSPGVHGWNISEVWGRKTRSSNNPIAIIKFWWQLMLFVREASLQGSRICKSERCAPWDARITVVLPKSTSELHMWTQSYVCVGLPLKSGSVKKCDRVTRYRSSDETAQKEWRIRCFVFKCVLWILYPIVSVAWFRCIEKEEEEDEEEEKEEEEEEEEERRGGGGGGGQLK